MHVKIEYTPKGMSIFIIDGFEMSKIGTQAFSSYYLNEDKVKLIKQIFSEDKDYNTEKFFKVWLIIKHFRFTRFATETMVNNMITKLREMLENNK